MRGAKPKTACPVCRHRLSLVLPRHHSASKPEAHLRTRRCKGCGSDYVTREVVERILRVKNTATSSQPAT